MLAGLVGPQIDSHETTPRVGRADCSVDAPGPEREARARRAKTAVTKMSDDRFSAEPAAPPARLKIMPAKSLAAVEQPVDPYEEDKVAAVLLDKQKMGLNSVHLAKLSYPLELRLRKNGYSTTQGPTGWTVTWPKKTENVSLSWTDPPLVTHYIDKEGKTEDFH